MLVDDQTISSKYSQTPEAIKLLLAASFVEGAGGICFCNSFFPHISVSFFIGNFIESGS